MARPSRTRKSRSAATKSNCVPTARSVSGSRCRMENTICPPSRYQIGVDHLWRDRAERESHARRPRNQTAFRRHVQFPVRAAGWKIRSARRRGIRSELIIYGATEPNAKVTLGGHEIKLRSDGTFSFRFALPDGKYDLPAVAVSADGTDGRAAELKFSRTTEYLGDVGATPQDPALKPPLPDNL